MEDGEEEFGAEESWCEVRPMAARKPGDLFKFKFNCCYGNFYKLF